MNIINLENVTKKYKIGDDYYEALKGVDLKVEVNEFLTIMGPSGSGKSTMLHILGCLDVPTSGLYELDGKDVTKMSDDQLSKVRNEKIGFVFQSFNLLAKLSVIDNVMLPFLYSNVPNKERTKRAMEALEIVGLTNKLENKPNQLSGGQIQRVAIARSLVMKPAIILADEPTGNLDTKTGTHVMETLQKINEIGTTIILITHDDHISKYGTRRVFIKDGFLMDKLTV